MLVFVDQSKHIKVMRATRNPQGKLRRERIGVVQKAALELSHEIGQVISKEEAEEIGRVLDFYRQAELATRNFYVARFPEIIREVMTYYETSARETEKQLIATSLSDAARKIRNQESATKKDAA